MTAHATLAALPLATTVEAINELSCLDSANSLGWGNVWARAHGSCTG